MIKRDEVTDPRSCLNRAQPHEMLFVLLARDPAAPAAIRTWISERIRLGKNDPDDSQIADAKQCIAIMEGSLVQREWPYIYLHPEELLYVGTKNHIDYPDLVDSIRELGQLDPVPVKLNRDGKYEYEEGKGRVEACMKLGINVHCRIISI